MCHKTELMAFQVSVVGDDGKLQKKVQVRRLVAHSKQQQLSNAQKKLSYELKLLIGGQRNPQDVTSSTVSYNMQTEDDYLHNDWFVNQSFGFHGNLREADLGFLKTFLWRGEQEVLASCWCSYEVKHE